MNYKEDMKDSINQIFGSLDVSDHIKAVYYKDILFHTDIYQDFNPLFHQIRKHKLELLDEIIEESEL